MGIRQRVFAAERDIGRLFYNKHVWLVSDRKMTAGDNGEAFFRYLQDKDVNSVFAISKSSSDYKRLKKIGNVVDYDSLKHKFLLCVADCHCSSQLIHMENHKETPQIFLQHGVAFSSIYSMMKRAVHDNMYVLTSATVESRQIVEAPDEYTKKHIWITGMPRFDYLKDNSLKKIIIAFTWRCAFADKSDEEILGTDYMKCLNRVMSDEKLHKDLLDRGYSLSIKLHPEMVGYSHLLKESEYCHFYTEDYNKMYEEASVMVTDFSSTVGDFAYLFKPVIYFQFDKEDFYKESIYLDPGEFDFDKDGFGSVVNTYDEFRDTLIRVIDNGCIMEDKYCERVKSFFKYHDYNNCDRVYERICALLDKKC